MNGTVFASEGGRYQVRLEDGELLEASLRGRLKRQARTGDRVVIGDLVEVRTGVEGGVTIEEVLPRRSEVTRRGAGGRRPKVLAANVDMLLVVAAAARPDPRQVLLDRLLTVGEANGLDTVLVMNKMDLEREGPGVEPLLALYRGIGYRVLETSTATGQGLDELARVLASGISALVGPSGVGKTSLLNGIQPALGLRTGELSHKQGRGRHTTVSARLIQLDCGGVVADTPGFSDVGLWAVDSVELEGCFPEFSQHRSDCRFRGCSHLHEPGCRVRDALEAGAIDPVRFESYRTLFLESEA
ncbi:ribosome small subunit-dependent GTPase A [Gemmatimonadota bacterium]